MNLKSSCWGKEATYNRGHISTTFKGRQNQSIVERTQNSAYLQKQRRKALSGLTRRGYREIWDCNNVLSWSIWVDRRADHTSAGVHTESSGSEQTTGAFCLLLSVPVALEPGASPASFVQGMFTCGLSPRRCRVVSGLLPSGDSCPGARGQCWRSVLSSFPPDFMLQSDSGSLFFSRWLFYSFEL